jgi:cellobiose transport system substrate-binding protein
MRRNTGTYRSRAVVLAAIAALGAGLLSGCADDGDSETDKSGGGGGGGGKTKIIMGLFGTMGFKEAGLYDAYMELHPEITIEQTVIERNENYYPQLLNHLSTGSGLADVQGIEVANIAEVVQTQADKFVDLSKTAGVRKENWLDWKWQQSITKDGKAVGLATDIGPMAICYRKDLFQKAGLPTDREKVAQLWAGDWNKYVDAGKEYMKKAPSGTAFVDSAGGVFNAVVAGNAPYAFASPPSSSSSAPSGSSRCCTRAGTRCTACSCPTWTTSGWGWTTTGTCCPRTSSGTR